MPKPVFSRPANKNKPAFNAPTYRDPFSGHFSVSEIPADPYQTIVRPHLIFAVSPYFLRYWLPQLTPGQAWLVVALRQRCYQNQRRDWCEVSYAQLAADTGLHPATVKNFFRSPHISRFIPHIQAQYRPHPEHEHNIRIPNRYELASEDPLTPTHLTGLSVLFKRAGLAKLEAILTDLAELSSPDLHWQLREAARGTPEPALTASSILSLIEHLFEGKQSSQTEEAALKVQARLMDGSPYLGTQYFRLHWVPLLGPALAWLVVLLRQRCYYNARTGEARYHCTWSKSELAHALGQSRRHLFGRLVHHPLAPAFFETLNQTAGQVTFRVRMWQEQEPFTPADQWLFKPALTQLSLWPDIFDSQMQPFLPVERNTLDIFDSPGPWQTGQNSLAFKHLPNTLEHWDSDSLITTDTSQQTDPLAQIWSDQSEISLTTWWSGEEPLPEAQTQNEAKWQETLEQMRPHFAKDTFSLIQRRTFCLEQDDQRLVIGVLDEQIHRLLQQRLAGRLEEIAVRVWRQPVRLEFQLTDPSLAPGG